ncbi:hypothetical protein [Flavobacterium sp.]|jgi:hypothetical protein|uniref:hypothetical protein n=1 Tax=Flavobacterium sp. TaxID=239 RepID=UPI0025DAC593|nr:hypothetical protein [Flavobacterium sp.]
MKTQFNKYVYIALIILGIIYLKEKSIGQALIYLGIALAFDPFDTNQKFNDRPTWQKMVLIVNLAIVFGLIFIEIFNLFF